MGLASAALDAKISPAERVLDVVRTAAYGMTATWREEYDPLDDARGHQLMAALGVDELGEQRFGTLSTGEKKRVGIARALMPNPELLVLDEPASGLDLGGREHLLQSLTGIAASAYAPVMVLVTHHVEEIPAGFTHALLLREGKVFAAGELANVLTDENLSAVFDLPVQVTAGAGRYVARAA